MSSKAAIKQIADTEIDPETHSANMREIIDLWAGIARRKPEERVSLAILIAEVAKGNPPERPTVAAILAELNEMTPGLIEQVTAAVPEWNGGQLMKPPTEAPEIEAPPVNFLTVATDLINRGFSVIPLEPRNKKTIDSGPGATDFGPGATDRTRDLKVVAAWAERWPHANVAICADENFVILESDNEAIFRKYIKELTGEDLPKTLTSGARENRPHWIYRRGAVPEGVKNLSADGIFELRATNYYVVGPGSIHPEGHRYQIREDREPAVFPKWLLDTLKIMDAAKQGQKNAGIGVYCSGRSRSDQVPSSGRTVFG